MLTDLQDAFGHAIADYYHGAESYALVEREDLYLDASGEPSVYFAPCRRWPPYERKAIRYARGRTLDIGCGAGRVLLYLQERGQVCVGIDNSPLAIQVCRERGVRDARLMPITRVGSHLGVFDSIVLFGNNFGLMGSRSQAQQLLRRFFHITSPGARLIAESSDPYDTQDPNHLLYHQWNRERGHMGGQVRMRIRYKKFRTPWFDYLLVSRQEMIDLLDGTGWRVKTFIDSDGPPYMAILEKV